MQDIRDSNYEGLYELSARFFQTLRFYLPIHINSIPPENIFQKLVAQSYDSHDLSDRVIQFRPIQTPLRVQCGILDDLFDMARCCYIINFAKNGGYHLRESVETARMYLRQYDSDSAFERFVLRIRDNLLRTVQVKRMGK